MRPIVFNHVLPDRAGVISITVTTEASAHAWLAHVKEQAIMAVLFTAGKAIEALGADNPRGYRE